MSTERRFANIGHLHEGTYLPLTAGSGNPVTGDLYLQGYLWISSAQPNLWFRETDVAATGGLWRLVASGSAFYGQLWNQAIDTGTTWLTVTGTGAGVTGINLNSTSTISVTTPYFDFVSTANTLYGRIFYNSNSLAGYLCGNADGVGFLTTSGSWGARMEGATGNLSLYANLTLLGTTAVIYPGSAGIRWDYPSLGRTYSNAATVLGNNVYVNPSDAVSGQVRTTTTHASYGHTIYELYGGNHYWYGNNNSVTADAVVTKRTLATLSVAGSFQALDEFRVIGSSFVLTGTSLYVNSSAPRTITDTNGSYGTISLGGSKNTYSGIRFDASYWTTNLMFATNNTLWGFYSEASGTWDLLYNTGELSFAAQKKIVAYGDTTTASDWGTRARMTRGTVAASGGADGDIYFRTGATKGLWINIAGTWTQVA